MGKIIISGEGGQGVRVISHTLATLLANLGYEVSLLYDYDSSVRGAMSMAYLIFDKEPIANPVVQEADILLKFSDKAEGLRAEKIVCQTGLCTDEEIAFDRLGIKEFGKEIFGIASLGQVNGVRPVAAEDLVFLPERMTNTHGDGLGPHGHMHGSFHLVIKIVGLDCRLDLPYQVQFPVEGQV